MGARNRRGPGWWARPGSPPGARPGGGSSWSAGGSVLLLCALGLLAGCPAPVDTSCAADDECAEGFCCVESSCQDAGGAACHALPEGETICEGVRANVLTDSANCGSCGTPCHLDKHCEAGHCRCSEPLPDLCGLTCVNLAEDPAHCGGCEVACGEQQYCQGGSCACTVVSGGTACGPDCVELQTSTAHCGSCEHACEPGQRCTAGSCEP